VTSSVEAALQDFLADRQPVLSSREKVVAASALAVARRLDRADARSAGGLARSLVDLCWELRGEAEPDQVDELIKRREARLLRLQVAKTASRDG
jgi:hypothetical protein